MAENTGKNERSQLLYTRRNAFDALDKAEIAAAYAFGEDYKAFLGAAKTEREAVARAVSIAEAHGFAQIAPDAWSEQLPPGARVYKNLGGKSLMLSVIGKRPILDGLNIVVAHVDAPRLDLKQLPLYEDGEMAFFK
ncbi:MAG: aminopeptidase, partial [Oscillospiraceae bacterium]|nr:aminopeptidase [Oscillospiraceae bacterium]